MEKQRLRRTCNMCSHVFDVARQGDNCYHWKNAPNEPIRVSWTSDPYQEELYEDFTKMWLCDNCWFAARDEI